MSLFCLDFFKISGPLWCWCSMRKYSNNDPREGHYFLMLIFFPIRLYEYIYCIRRRQLRSFIIDLMSMAHVGKWCGQNKLLASIFHSWAVIGMTPRGSNDSKIARVYRSIILLKCCQFRQTCLHLDLATAMLGVLVDTYVYPNICLPTLSFILGSKNIGDESCFFVCFQYYTT